MRVLSIDIDVLFDDCHDYQRFIDEDLSPELSWATILPRYDKPFEPNYKTLAWLSSLLEATVTTTSELVKIERHDEIVSVLEEYKADNAFMTNIDEHHDITYENDDAELTIENWVKHARHRNLIRSYQWIHTDMSYLCKTSPFIYSHNSWKDVSTENFEPYDLVVICKSPYFTPPNYWCLVDILANKFEKIKEDKECQEQEEQYVESQEQYVG